MTRIHDAHNHLHDARLDPVRDAAIAMLRADGVGFAMINGTREDDWERVGQLCAQHPWMIPSFGLHPWHVPNRTALWKENLLREIEARPDCGVGEIGLDRWIEGHDLDDQLACFHWQLELAAERNLPVSIHCVRAWGALWDALRAARLPGRGFLIHAYSGPAEMVPGFIQRGAYFSFSPYFLHDRKAQQRELFASLPIERVLVETDAPDLAPPDSLNPHPLADGLNHPGNLAFTYAALASLRAIPTGELAEVVTENFARWTGRRV